MNPNQNHYAGLQEIRRQYPVGATIELMGIHDDLAAIAPGSIGTILCVDDAGQIHVKWGSGLRLALIPGMDQFRVIR